MYEDGTGLVTIGTLARRTGIPVKTIRNWSDLDLLPTAARTPAGYRLFPQPAAGIAPDSPAATPVVAELAAAWLPTRAATADPPDRDGAAARDRLREQLEAAADPSVARYWELLCAVTGRPAPPRWDRAGTWTAAAPRAHRTPVEIDRAAFAQCDPDRVLYAYRTVTREVAALAAAVRTADLELPTPCGGWRVRELLGHLVWENLMVASVADGDPRTDHTADHTADHIGDDHAAAFDDSTRTALAAFTRSGMLHRTYGPYAAPGAMLVQQVVVELLAHGWDLARAIGAPTVLGPEVAEETLAAARRIYGAAPRTEGGSFAPERAALSGASAADRLAAYLGRDPG
ncbi:TIGR03086 family metal-binding protein [Streptomyces sp. NPDC048644]|uniref:TIGR03086 family metal-binding protein n=1 Tax=Streptomyces sp. NPDC048644 TaxID=3365582 RepID=UPI00371B7C74